MHDVDADDTADALDARQGMGPRTALPTLPVTDALCIVPRTEGKIDAAEGIPFVIGVGAPTSVLLRAPVSRSRGSAAMHGPRVKNPSSDAVRLQILGRQATLPSATPGARLGLSAPTTEDSATRLPLASSRAPMRTATTMRSWSTSPSRSSLSM